MAINQPNYPRPKRPSSGFKDNSNLDKLFNKDNDIDANIAREIVSRFRENEFKQHIKETNEYIIKFCKEGETSCLLDASKIDSCVKKQLIAYYRDKGFNVALSCIDCMYITW